MQYVNAVDVSYEGPNKAQATVAVSQHATVTVHVHRAVPGTPASAECSCRKPLDVGMPCKHVVAVLRALDRQRSASAPQWGRLNACWFHEVWHAASWRRQYEEAFVVVEVRGAH